MATTRKRYSAEFKAKVALEAIRGVQTLSELGARFKVHPMLIAQWKRVATEQLAAVFEKGRPRGRDEEVEKQALFEQIGRLKMELDWTKKKAGLLEG
jgi:transposase